PPCSDASNAYFDTPAQIPSRTAATAINTASAASSLGVGHARSLRTDCVAGCLAAPTSQGAGMIGMILAAGVLLVPAPPPAAQPIIRGPGEQSCATWQSDETNKVAGGIWLLGYWTGLSQ